MSNVWITSPFWQSCASVWYAPLPCLLGVCLQLHRICWNCCESQPFVAIIAATQLADKFLCSALIKHTTGLCYLWRCRLCFLSYQVSGPGIICFCHYWGKGRILAPIVKDHTFQAYWLICLLTSRTDSHAGVSLPTSHNVYLSSDEPDMDETNDTENHPELDS